MKKFIALFLVVVMCFALAACGSKGISKEEMLAQAVAIDDYRSEMMGNFARAEEKLREQGPVYDDFGVDMSKAQEKQSQTSKIYRMR